MKTLHLTLKKKWFDMYLAGIKKEEYREVKDYWYKRLINPNLRALAKAIYSIFYQMVKDGNASDEDIIKGNNEFNTFYNDFDTITFTNGYAKKARQFVIELKEITIGKGNPEWGAPTEHVFILKLGNILSTKNINT